VQVDYNAMNIYADKSEKQKTQWVSTQQSNSQITHESASEQYSNLGQTMALTSLQAKADSSPQVGQATQLQAAADVFTRPKEPVQRKENNTGLPDTLKSGIENLSGISMDDVKVHRNSDKPAQLNAHAFAQGTDIHLGAGQEKHLPHEAWHVVQQKQGRVQPTKQLKGKVNVNDDAGLEKEADVMGNKALQMKNMSTTTTNVAYVSNSSNLTQLYANNQVIQREGEGNEVEYEAEEEINLDDQINLDAEGDQEIDLEADAEETDESAVAASHKVTPESRFAQIKRGITHFKNSIFIFSQFSNMANTADDGLVAGGIDVAKDSPVRDVGFLNNLLPFVSKFAVMPIFSAILNISTIKTVRTSQLKKIQSKKAFAKLMESESTAAKVGIYAYKKVSRAIVDTYILLGSEFIDLIGNISAIIGAFVAGIGAMFGGVLKTISSAIKAFRIVGRSLKGVWKFITGRKGVNRANNSATLVSAAADGDEDAAEAIFDLRPKNIRLDDKLAKWAYNNRGKWINYPTNGVDVIDAIDILAVKKPEQLDALRKEIMDKMRSTSDN